MAITWLVLLSARGMPAFVAGWALSSPEWPWSSREPLPVRRRALLRNGLSRGGSREIRNDCFGVRRFAGLLIGNRSRLRNVRNGIRLGIPGNRNLFRNWRGFIDGSLLSHVEALDRLPDPGYGSGPVLELLYRGHTRHAVPDVDQSSGRPFRSPLRQRGFVAEPFRVGDIVGFLRRSVDSDVVRLVFNREVLHLQSPGAAITALTTFITPVENTSKQIVRPIERIVQMELAMSAGISR
jgi:hypothetical protein